MQNFPAIIETALLLLIVFLIGCVIGWIFRARIFTGKLNAEPIVTPNPAKTRTASAPESVSALAFKKSNSDKKDKQVAASPTVLTKKTTNLSPSSIEKLEAEAKVTIAPAVAQADIADKMDDLETGGTSNSLGRPKGLDGPRGGKSDDLKKIKGIGPKLEQTLNGLGIYHFDQITTWERTEIDWVDNFLSFKGRIERDKWIDQANSLK